MTNVPFFNKILHVTANHMTVHIETSGSSVVLNFMSQFRTLLKIFVDRDISFPHSKGSKQLVLRGRSTGESATFAMLSAYI